jgi:hypothetical protein
MLGEAVPLFVELCAGTAAVSLRLHRDGARPPVSRMGSKSGFASVILRVLGLVPGQRAAAYLWCEPDPGVRLLLEAYRDGALAKAAAAIIRSWAAEDPRALWERLRGEGPPRLPDGGAEAGEVARSYLLGAWSFRQSEPESGFVASDNHSKPGRPGGRQSVATLASGIKGNPTLPAAIAPDARQVDPREVARVLQIIASNELINVAWSDVHNAWRNTGIGGTTFGGPIGYGGDRVPGKLEALPVPLPALIHPDARAVDPGPALLPGTVAYMDPPYVGTTGYAADLPRAEVVALARRWAAAGATVCISEAEAIPDLVAEGWHAVRIDGERVGQRRTFSRQQAEWLTLNRAPAWVPSVQGALFGGAK